MGLGPIMSIYQARYNKYLQNRRIDDTHDSRVWCFLGDGEVDEPETLGAISLASREHLDNLTWVVNCNLQRLDGPVRGNGKIIQELEAIFRGAGWNVIKVVWGRGWDELLAQDVDGVLLNKMNTTVDGEFQRYAVEPGSYIRENFFGPDPRLRAMVEHLTDEQLEHLPRGGHDYHKLYAAYSAAVETKGMPTVILAKTIKGWTLGKGFEGRNSTHQIKKMTAEQLMELRTGSPDRRCPSPRLTATCRRTCARRSTRRSPSTCWTGAGRWTGRCPSGWCTSAAPSPSRRTRRTRSCTRAPASRRCRRPPRSRACCATCAATSAWGRGSCRSSPTRRAPSAWTRCSASSASTPPRASCTSRSTTTCCCRTRSRPTGRSSRRASPRPARWPRGSRRRRATRPGACRSCPSTPSIRCSGSSGSVT